MAKIALPKPDFKETKKDRKFVERIIRCGEHFGFNFIDLFFIPSLKLRQAMIARDLEEIYAVARKMSEGEKVWEWVKANRPRYMPKQ